MSTSNVTNQLSILHLISDAKFIGYAMELFDQVGYVKNHYLIIKSADEHRIKSENLEYISGIDELSCKLKFYQSFDCIFVHSLNQKHRDFLDALRFPNLKVWKGYGKDYYDLIYDDPYTLYLPETRRLQRKLHSFGVRARIKKIGKKLLGINRNQLKERIKYLNAFDLFLPIVEEEYLTIKSRHPDFKPVYFGWNYNLSLTGQELPDIENEINVLVGNSATATNNHLEVFGKLALFDLTSRKVVVPLSYGTGIGAYRDAVVEAGQKLLGDNFYPLTGFMNYNEYSSLIGSCSIVVMNHMRQQAAGNLYLMLWKGAKVYMQTGNPLYRNLVRKGLVLFDVEDLDPRNEDSLTPLSLAEREQNRKIMESFLNPIDAMKRTEELCAVILGLRAKVSHAGKEPGYC